MPDESVQQSERKRDTDDKAAESFDDSDAFLKALHSHRRRNSWHGLCSFCAHLDNYILFLNNGGLYMDR